MSEPDIFEEEIPSTALPKKKRKPRKIRELFAGQKLDGGIPDTPADASVADAVVAQCALALGALRKIGPKMRVEALRRITKEMNAVSQSVNCAVFKRTPDAPEGPQLL